MLEQRIIEQLFRRNYSEMIRLARVLLACDGEAEDVVQDVFLRVANSDIPPKNDSYLLIAVRNACLNKIRQMQLHEQVKNLLPIEDETDQQPIAALPCHRARRQSVDSRFAKLARCH